MIKKRLVAYATSLFAWCRGRDLNPHGVTRLILSQVRLPFRHPGISLVPGTLCFSAWHKNNYTITSRIVKYFFELFLT